MAGESIWQNLQVLEDPSSSLTTEEVLSGARDASFKQVRSPNFGFSKSRFWFKLEVQNIRSEKLDWFLEYNFPLIDEVEIYGKNIPNSTKTRLGDSFPFDDRNRDYRNIIFPLEENPNSTSTYYIRLQSESTIPLSLQAYTNKEMIQKMNKEQIIFGLFYGIMFVMAAYNLFIYIFTRDKSYMLYVFFISSISMFHFVNNGLAFQYLWPNWVWWANYSLPFFICFSSFTGLLFATNFLFLRKNANKLFKFMMYFAYFMALVGVATFFLSYRFGMILSIGLTVPSAIIMISSGVIAFIKKIRTSRYYLIAWSFFLLGVILYSLKSLGVLPDNHITRWTIQIGTALEVILLSLGLADRINYLSRSLKESVRDLSQAKTKIEESEKRFREIFQGSEEVILMLDEEFSVINGNRALSKILGFRLDDVKGKKLTDMLYKGKGHQSDLNAILVNDKITDLKMTGSIINFKTAFAQKYVKEPKEMLCRLQYVVFDENREVIATLSPEIEDTIIQLIDSEKIELTMNNYLRNAELVSQKITSQLAKYLNSIEQTEVRSSIREIIINAVEHGNLNISFEEKSKALIEGNYLEFLQKRQEDPRYRDKKVKIEYTFNKDYVAYRVTDEGKGFDHKKHLERSLEKLNEDNAQHGRGILMSKSVFQRIEYNEKGNQVSLIKYLNQ